MFSFFRYQRNAKGSVMYDRPIVSFKMSMSWRIPVLDQASGSADDRPSLALAYYNFNPCKDIQLKVSLNNSDIANYET